MNYSHGFPIFDDKWEDDKTFPQKTLPMEKPVKDTADSNIKLENKPKNTGLFQGESIMTQWQKFKENTYQQMLGKHRAKFMIESFYLDYDAGTLLVTYSKGSDSIIYIDPEEYDDVYAFERELQNKLVIGAVPEKECWGGELAESMVHYLVRTHMNDFVYVSDETLNELSRSIGYSVDYIMHKATNVVHAENISIMLKDEADKIKLPVAYNYCVKLPVKSVSEKELALI